MAQGRTVRSRPQRRYDIGVMEQLLKDELMMVAMSAWWRMGTTMSEQASWWVVRLEDEVVHDDNNEGRRWCGCLHR